MLEEEGRWLREWLKEEIGSRDPGITPELETRTYFGREAAFVRLTLGSRQIDRVFFAEELVEARLGPGKVRQYLKDCLDTLMETPQSREMGSAG